MLNSTVPAAANGLPSDRPAVSAATLNLTDQEEQTFEEIRLALLALIAEAESAHA